MKKLQIGNSLVVFLVFALTIVGYGQTNQPDNSLERARELWELAVAAKGGRERLNQVTNFVEIYHGKNIYLVVLPDKYLSWYDTSPSEFGLNVTIYNFESGFGFSASGKLSQEVYKDMRKEMKSYENAKMEFLFTPQLEYFLETRWLRPKVLSASKATIGGKSVDRVDVLVEVESLRKRFAVFLDEKTHLAVRIAHCRDEQKGDLSIRVMDFRAYREIAGIKIPTENCAVDCDKWNRLHFEINVEYNPGVFGRLPDPKAGPYQWRKPGSKAVGPSLAKASQPEPLTPAQITQLIKDLESPEEEVKRFALRDLTAAGKQVVPALSEALQSGSRTLRYGVVVALIKLGEETPAITKALSDLLLDPQAKPEERQDAAFGLLRNDQGIAALTDLLEHPEVSVRRIVIFAFDQLTERSEIPQQVQKAIPALRKLTKDKDLVVREMAKEVLEQIGDRFKR